MKLTFLGSGDAFGSGGRYQTCFHVVGETANFLIDCGASSMIPLRQHGIDANAIETILLTHFHADHCGGIPFFILHARMLAKRTQPLTIAGPQGLLEWFNRSMEISFPGSTRVDQAFDVSLIELGGYETTDLGMMQVTPFVVSHGAGEKASYAYRIMTENRVIAYTGDTEWTDRLIDAGREADLMIAEAYFYERKIKFHLDFTTLSFHLEQIRPQRLVLTHMSDNMLARRQYVPYTVADDGLVVEF